MTTPEIHQLPTPNIAGAIIAGGKSSRFGEENKALASLSGKTVLEHIYRRLISQTDQIWLNTSPNFPVPHSLSELLAHRIQDPTEDQMGPLIGILAVLEQLPTKYEWLLICPCDTPFIPKNLSQLLYKACIEKNVTLAISQSNNRFHPSLSLWHKSLLEDLKKAVQEENKVGFKQFYPSTKHCFVEWSAEKYDPFFNINYPQDLHLAQGLFDTLDIH